ncbi:MAG: tetratricopeptide repeat protein [Proteobacteria bacterium]|nr:tetratricopeptide repeat protein [Pseudomonadota bacterium]
MKKKLLLSTLSLVFMGALAPTPLLASAHDDTGTSAQARTTHPDRTADEWWQHITNPDRQLTAHECLLAINSFRTRMNFLSQGAHAPHELSSLLSQEGHAFHELFKTKPMGVDALRDATPSEREQALSLMKEGCYAFFHLSQQEKQTYKDTYISAMRTLLESEKKLAWGDYLPMVDSLLLFEQRDLAKVAAERYFSQPDIKASYKPASLLAASAHCLLGEEARAGHLYTLSFLLRPNNFSINDLRNALHVFQTLKQHENAAKSSRMLLAKNGASYKFDDLIVSDFFESAINFVSTAAFGEAREALHEYFARETGAPLPCAYVLMAECYNAENDYERACQYWDAALRAGATLHHANYMNAASSFARLNNYQQAHTLLEEALASGEFASDFISLSYAADLYHRCGDGEKAQEYAERAFSMRHTSPTQEGLSRALLNIAAIYIRHNNPEKAQEILNTIYDDPSSDQTPLIKAGLLSYKNGNLQMASNCFDKGLRDKGDIPHTCLSFLPVILLCHMDAGHQARAQSVLMQHPDILGSSQTRTPSTKASKGRAPASSSAQRASKKINASTIATLRTHLIEAVRTDIRTAARAVASASDHAPLADLRAQIIDLAESLSRSRSDTSASQTSSSSSSSSADATEASLPHLQRIKEQVEGLKKEFDRKRYALEKEDFKARKRALIQTAALESSTSLDGPASSTHTERVKAIRGKKQKSQAVAPRASRASTPSQDRTSSAVSACSGVAPLPAVEWRISQTGRKHMEILKSVPGFQAKFDAFRRDINNEPWARRGHAQTHATGRAKLLKGYENIFSRRFAGGERFFYRVERQEGGRVVITILGLMKHDL